MKVANVKLEKKCLPGEGARGGTLPNAHKNTCVYLLMVPGEGTSNNRLGSP